MVEGHGEEWLVEAWRREGELVELDRKKLTEGGGRRELDEDHRSGGKSTAVGSIGELVQNGDSHSIGFRSTKGIRWWRIEWEEEKRKKMKMVESQDAVAPHDDPVALAGEE